MWFPSGNVNINYNKFVNTYGFRIYTDNAVKVYIKNNLFYKGHSLNYSGYWNFYILVDSQDLSEVTIKYNSFIDMNDTVLKLSDSSISTFSASENYWGTQDKNVIETMIYDRNDDIRCVGYVNYLPILTEPHPDTPFFSTPIITTTLLSDATQDVPYSETILVEDPDEGDSVTFQLLDAPDWLSIDNSGILSGTPDNDDVDSNIPISIMVTDTFGLTDTLQTTINIINVLDPPLNFIVEDVPNDHGHRLQLRWDVSPDDEKGYVSFYRIYRSRSDVLTEPITLSQFTSIDSLMAWEEHYTILIDSVTAGITEYIDECVPLNNVPYYYWLQAVGANNESEKIAANAANIVVHVDENPNTFVLHPAYPNPFNPSTTIQFEINEKSHVRLVIYDILGREIMVIQDGLMGAGLHECIWNGRNKEGIITGSGVYIYKVIAGKHTAQRKVLFLR